MIIVTGGAGFIGSNIVKALNARGETNILVVDHVADGRKLLNLSGLNFADYMERDEFLSRVEAGDGFGATDPVFHQGACSATTEWDGTYLMANNYRYSKKLLAWCEASSRQFIYASSASVYGDGSSGFVEGRAAEHPINAYAASKFHFDQFVRRKLPSAGTQIVGLRYFNVYGPGETHKGAMASTAFHFTNQILDHGAARLFGPWGGFEAGGQMRDFVYVEDCAMVNLWFMDHPKKSGIFNCGSGKARTFLDMVKAVIAHHGKGDVEFIAFPEHLKGAYQSFTEADLSALRAAGYDKPFHSLEQGVGAYVDWLKSADIHRLLPNSRKS